VTPIEDVIASLVAIKLLIEEGGYNLPHFVRGLQVEKVQVNMTRLSQESHLKELLLVGMFLAFQKNLETEVPAMFEKITGTHVPDEFKTILTLSVLIVIFYGVAYVKDLMTAVSTNSKVKGQLDNLIEDLASRTGRTVDEVRAFLDARYKPKGRIKTLAAAAYGFFKPSKTQLNAPIRVNERMIASETVADVPQDYSYEEIMDAETATAFQGVELELHAQDKDREASGWAAIPKGLSDKRIKMRLLDGVTPGQLWGKNHVRGDIIIKYKRTGTDITPIEIHLMRVHD
jgi:3D (Asp-Asp-Asp) domain-containing protein